MENQENTVPDGGWGWIIVLITAFINIATQAVLSVYGLLFGELLEGMNQKTTGVAFVSNLCFLGVNFTGFIIGPIIKVFSPRSVVFFGCLLTGSGFMVCSLSTKLWHVILGYSFMFGIGLGLLTTSTFIAINSYFDKKKGRAVGIAMAGTGVGQMILPHIVNVLLDHYGFKVAIQIIASLSLFGLFGSLLFRPLKQNTDILIVKDENMNSVDDVPRVQKCAKIKNFFEKLGKSMDLELLKNIIFWNIMIGIALYYAATYTFAMIFPYYLQYSAELSRKDAASCMSVLAGADLVSRIFLPILTDKLKIPFRVTFLFGVTGMIVFRTFLAENKQLYFLLVYSAGYGISKSAAILNTNLTVSNYCTPDQLAGAIGLTMVWKAVSIITFGSFIGWLRDYTGSYSIILHAQNICLVLVVIFWMPELLYKCCKNRKLNDNSINQ